MTSVANGLPLHADHPPLRVNEEGAVRVGDTRVSLDLVIGQYENGMTPEDMGLQQAGTSHHPPPSLSWSGR
jgi:hypothetical protein